MITAKVFLTGKQKTNDEASILSFSADYRDGRNEEWKIYTPTLNLGMTVKNEVADKFTEGATYTLSFELDELQPFKA